MEENGHGSAGDLASRLIYYVATVAATAYFPSASLALFAVVAASVSPHVRVELLPPFLAVFVVPVIKLLSFFASLIVPLKALLIESAHLLALAAAAGAAAFSALARMPHAVVAAVAATAVLLLNPPTRIDVAVAAVPLALIAGNALLSIRYDVQALTYVPAAAALLQAYTSLPFYYASFIATFISIELSRGADSALYLEYGLDDIILLGALITAGAFFASIWFLDFVVSHSGTTMFELIRQIGL